MRGRTTLSMFTISFLFWGCAVGEKMIETKDPVVFVNQEDTIKVNEVIIVESFNESNIRSDFNIEYSLIHDDILEVHVTYSGGCAEHEFTLYSTKQYQKSLPPKLPILLVHDTGGDACRELKKETLLYDIKNLKYEGQQTIQLIMNTEYVVEYTY